MPLPSPALCLPISGHYVLPGRIGPFRWCALSGDPEDIYKTDAKVKELIPDDAHLHQLAGYGTRADCVSGPARADLLGRAGQRHKLGLAIQRNGASGELKAPVVIGRDHLDSGLGRFTQPGNRGDEGRLGRGLGLAAC